MMVLKTRKRVLKFCIWIFAWIPCTRRKCLADLDPKYLILESRGWLNGCTNKIVLWLTAQKRIFILFCLIRQWWCLVLICCVRAECCTVHCMMYWDPPVCGCTACLSPAVVWCSSSQPLGQDLPGPWAWIFLSMICSYGLAPAKLVVWLWWSVKGSGCARHEKHSILTYFHLFWVFRINLRSSNTLNTEFSSEDAAPAPVSMSEIRSHGQEPSTRVRT